MVQELGSYPGFREFDSPPRYHLSPFGFRGGFLDFRVPLSMSQFVPSECEEVMSEVWKISVRIDFQSLEVSR